MAAALVLDMVDELFPLGEMCKRRQSELLKQKNYVLLVAFNTEQLLNFTEFTVVQRNPLFPIKCNHSPTNTILTLGGKVQQSLSAFGILVGKLIDLEL